MSKIFYTPQKHNDVNKTAIITGQGIVYTPKKMPTKNMS